ncbi:sulfite exporter TauE/SafE family protein [Nocardioides marmoraquaticus]
MSGLEVLAVLGAGLGAGVLSATVGVASLLSFPVLLAVGLPPVTANASNTVGLVPGGLSGSLGYRRELREQPALARTILLVCSVAAVAGALLLLALPPGVFEAVVPWLILFTAVLVGVQPWVSRRVRERAGPDAEPRTRMSPLTLAGAAVTGVYGGYFGAGAGVMMMAVMGFGLDLEIRVVNALKTLSLMAGNVVASLVFLLLADLDWAAIALLATGSLVGGYVGAVIGRHLPDRVLRTAIVVAGVTAFALLL